MYEALAASVASKRRAAERQSEQVSDDGAEESEHQRRCDAESHQEDTGTAQVSEATAGDQSHLEQEERQHALEQTEEERLDRSQRVRSGKGADHQAAEQQHDTLAEQNLVRQRAPLQGRPITILPARQRTGEHDADHDARGFHQRNQQGHVGLAGDSGLQQEAGAHREGHD